MASGEPDPLDYRFSLANERTFLAWIRTAFALVAGGLLAAKVLDFDSEVWRWAVVAPPLAGGGLIALRSRARWRAYDVAMAAGRPLPRSADASALAFAVAAYALIVNLAVILGS